MARHREGCDMVISERKKIRKGSDVYYKNERKKNDVGKGENRENK